MTKIVFARPNIDLMPYYDLDRLIDLSGFPRIALDEIPRTGASDTTFIYTPILGSWDIEVPQTDGRVIGFDLEYRRESYPSRFDGIELWHFDAWQARQQSQWRDVAYVPIGSHPDFALPANDYVYSGKLDVAYVGYMGPPRRQQIAYQLDQRGITRSPEHAYGDERDVLLRMSRAYLHVHQHDDIAAVPGLRMAVAAAYGLPVICESVTDPGIFGTANVMWADYPHLVDFTAMWLRDPYGAARMADTGRALKRLLCEEYTFRRVIEDAVAGRFV